MTPIAKTAASVVGWSLGAAIALAACGTTATSTELDAEAIDLQHADGGSVAVRDARIDDRGADIGLDARPLPDSTAPPPRVRSVVFAHGDSDDLMTLATVRADGTGYQPVAGFGLLKLTERMFLIGRVNAEVERDGPFLLPGDAHSAVVLPKGRGVLKYFRESLGATDRFGFLLVRPSGQVEILYSTDNSNNTSAGLLRVLSPFIAVSDDGRLVATARNNRGDVVLARTDATTFKNGKTTIEIAPSPKPDSVQYLSLNIIKGELFFSTTRNGIASLWRVPIDGSAAPKHVDLASALGEEPPTIDAYPDSGGNGTVVVAAGKSVVDKTLLVVEPNGTVRRLTDKPGAPGSRGTYQPGVRLRVSPSGKWVAYVQDNRLWLASTSAPGTPQDLTNEKNVVPGKHEPRSLYWVGDDSLLFLMSDNVLHSGDLFRYELATKTLTNLTGQGGVTRPFVLSDSANISSIWRSPNGRYLYYLDAEWNTNDGQRNLRAIDLSNWTRLSVTSNAWISSVRLCATGSIAVLAGYAPAGSTAGRIWRFDQEKPTATAPTLQIAGDTTAITQIALSSTCDHAILAAERKGAAFDVYVASLTAPASLYRTYSGATQIHSALLTSAGGPYSVFAAGSAAQVGLRFVSLGSAASARAIHQGSKAYQVFGLD
ncbi:MAG: hypothetical protein H6707_04215 [Deltaproteobacteria bacterium]|nr:hypothetical protein [Deltaproteobacteria bacterium]